MFSLRQIQPKTLPLMKSCKMYTFHTIHLKQHPLWIQLQQ